MHLKRADTSVGGGDSLTVKQRLTLGGCWEQAV
jgi:hypothetical protein